MVTMKANQMTDRRRQVQCTPQQAMVQLVYLTVSQEAH